MTDCTANTICITTAHITELLKECNGLFLKDKPTQAIF